MDEYVRVGTSGWQYRDWKGTFYPDGLPAKDELAYYASVFDTVEVNSTFYHMPRVTTGEKWYRETPAGFRFTLKLNRFLTHTKRLAVDDESRRYLADFAATAAALGEKLGVVLVQLPPSLRYDLDRLRTFFDAARSHRLPLALECRHASWFTPETYALLDDYDVLWVINDSPDRWPSDRHTTKAGMYIRFHGNTELYKSSYSDAELAEWAAYIKNIRSERSWVYFNNDYEGVGARNAMTLRQYLSGQPDAGQSR